MPGWSVAVEHLHQMPAELGFHRAVNHLQRLSENDLVDGAYHLSWTHLAEVAAALFRGAGGVPARQHIECLAGGKALLQRQGFGLGTDQNVTGHGNWHRLAAPYSRRVGGR